MTPQLQQAIRLLQMSALELVTEVKTQIESNPLLEEDDSGPSSPVDPETELSGVDRIEPLGEQLMDSTDQTAADDGLRGSDVNGDKLLDADYDALFDPPTAPAGPASNSLSSDGGFQDLAERGHTHASLRQFLSSQLSTKTLSRRDRAIAVHIIDAIDDRGYLISNIADIAEIVSQQLPSETAQSSATAAENAAANTMAETQHSAHEPAVEQAEVEAVLKLIQNLEPDGVGARDLKECLAIQLRHTRRDCNDAELACRLIDHSLEDVAARNFKRMAQVHKSSVDQVERAVEIITALNPCPGDAITSQDAPYIIPDVFVRQHKGQWRAQLNSQTIPKVRLNSQYISLKCDTGTKTDNETSRYIKEHTTEAKWFLKSLHNRHETLLRVATEIVQQQTDFFDLGESAMKPMILSDVAQALDMHESTISRATNQKYMQTPIGVFELKYFFSSALTGSDGESHSSTAIRSHIREIIDDEAATKPMSDNKIANLLSDRGINVARRTVAKYRESMNIPSSSERKRLG